MAKTKSHWVKFLLIFLPLLILLVTAVAAGYCLRAERTQKERVLEGGKTWKFIAQNVSEIQSGFSPQEVLDLLGEPEISSEYPGTRITYFTYQCRGTKGPEQGYRVIFVDGRAREIRKEFYGEFYGPGDKNNPPVISSTIIMPTE